MSVERIKYCLIINFRFKPRAMRVPVGAGEGRPIPSIARPLAADVVFLLNYLIQLLLKMFVIHLDIVLRLFPISKYLYIYTCKSYLA